MNNIDKKFLSVSELAGLMNISRQAVLKKIKTGQIIAEKVGKNFVIQKKDLAGVIYDELTEKLKKEIEKGITRVIDEYGEVLKKLGEE